MDFTLNKYKSLLMALQQAHYKFITFEEFCKGRREDKFIILRHDVDEMAMNAVKMAKIENLLGIKATYNFRIVKQSNKPEIIKQIVALGHEIGYHYEDLAFANGDYEKAMETFRKNLAYFRQSFYPVKTVCMHGSSTSKYDNRDLWKRYSLADEQLLGEPYFSIDFDKIYYISDTGYCWDGFKTAVRDVVLSSFSDIYHHTDEIIAAIKKDKFPPQAMILAHTLWTDSGLLWSFIFAREKLRNWLKNLSKNNILAKKIYAWIVKSYWRR